MLSISLRKSWFCKHSQYVVFQCENRDNKQVWVALDNIRIEKIILIWIWAFFWRFQLRQIKYDRIRQDIFYACFCYLCVMLTEDNFYLMLSFQFYRCSRIKCDRC